MVIRFARLLVVAGALCGIATQAAAQAGYPQPQPQPQPTYAPPPAQPQPVQPQPAPAPGYPQPAPAPFGAQPQPAPAPAPGYPPPPAQQYPGFPVPPADTMQPPPGGIPDGAFQLGLFTTFVRYEPIKISVENNGPEYDISTLKWGIADNPVGIELGYGLSDMVVFGGVVGLGGTSNSQSSDGQADIDTSEFALELGPKLDLMFSPGSTVMPFIGAQVLLHLESQDAGGGAETSNTVFLFVARGGLRAFVADSFSIDPAVFFGGGFGSGSQNGGGGATDVDYDVSGFRVGLSLGFSGWML